MTPENFCYWLQGYFEVNLNDPPNLNPKQVEIIQRHLSLVFEHSIDPKAGGPEVQKKLNEIHKPSSLIRC